MCGCDPDTPSQEDRFDHIFSARVTKVLNAGQEHIVNVEKIKSYKGYQNESFDLFTPSDANACNVSFMKDTTYLVYAKIDNAGRLYTDSCSHTAESVDSDQEVKANERARIERARGVRVDSVKKTSSQTFPFLVFIIISAGALIVGLGFNKK